MQKSTTKKQCKNLFIEKFHLLNSQESSQDINWSCSDSSEYEDHLQCDTLKNTTKCYTRRKRKRINSRRDLNISNLDITVVETDQDTEKTSPRQTSPMINGSSKFELCKSPILSSSIGFKNTAPTTEDKGNMKTEAKTTLKSPVITLKYQPSKMSPKVKKKLFQTDKLCVTNNKENISFIASVPSLVNDKDYLDRRKCPDDKKYYKQTNNQLDNCFTNVSKDKTNGYLNNEQRVLNLNNNHREYSKYEDVCINSSGSSSENNATNITKSHAELVARVKTYFDNYFSSQGTQHSISECETPTPDNSSKNSDEIEIVNSITQVQSLPSPNDEKIITSFDNHTNTRSKKLRYKNGGLAYRLNALLKKQNSNISLWQHERFLAANSNFVVPKMECLAFRIKNVIFKFSVHLLNVISSDNKKFMLVINNIYVNIDNCFLVDNVIKIYQPYYITDFKSDCKLITNVCKFECAKFEL